VASCLPPPNGGSRSPPFSQQPCTEEPGAIRLFNDNHSPRTVFVHEAMHVRHRRLWRQSTCPISIHRPNPTAPPAAAAGSSIGRYQPTPDPAAIAHHSGGSIGTSSPAPPASVPRLRPPRPPRPPWAGTCARPSRPTRGLDHHQPEGPGPRGTGKSQRCDRSHERSRRRSDARRGPEPRPRSRGYPPKRCRPGSTRLFHLEHPADAHGQVRRPLTKPSSED
jgi:hypothetical protein